MYKIVYIILLFTASLTACKVTLQNYTLENEYAVSLHYQPTPEGANPEEEKTEKSELKGLPARNYMAGDLKRGAVWWAGAGIQLERGDEYIFSFAELERDSVAFGATFPPLDFSSEKIAVKITAKYSPDSSSKDLLPTLCIQLSDAEGYVTNYKWPAQTITDSTQYSEYYFDLQNKELFQQVFPDKHEVNAGMINNIRFFVNPGKQLFKGQLFFKEIKIVTSPQN